MPCLYAQAMNTEDPGQQISDFFLSGYGEKGKKSWDLKGRSANIFKDTVKLEGVTGNFYGDSEDVRISADRGDFNKTDGRVRLEQNVVVATSSGAILTTDSLDWDRKAGVVSTADQVNIKRDNIITVAKGAVGEPGLKRLALEKDVKLDIYPESKTEDIAKSEKEKIVITCDGSVEISYEKNFATFNKNVKVERGDAVIYSDRMDVFFTPGNKTAQDQALQEGSGMIQTIGSKIEKIVAKGNVKVVQGENISYSDEALYTAADKKIILSGKPKLIIYSEEDSQDAPFGN